MDPAVQALVSRQQKIDSLKQRLIQNQQTIAGSQQQSAAMQPTPAEPPQLTRQIEDPQGPLSTARILETLGASLFPLTENTGSRPTMPIPGTNRSLDLMGLLSLADAPNAPATGLLKAGAPFAALIGKQASKSTKGIRVFHGSPAEFLQGGKFSSEFINKGQGAQTFGHGLYFAENAKVAGRYKSLRRGQDGIQVEADIDVKPEHFLDWDLPWSKQHPQVQRRLEAFFDLNKNDPGFSSPSMAFIDKSGGSISSASVAHRMRLAKKFREMSLKERRAAIGDPTGQEIAEVGSGSAHGKPGVAQKLRESGIPGIRYMDEGTRTTLGGRITDISKGSDGKWRSRISFKSNTRLQGKPPTTTISPRFDTKKEAEKWANDKVSIGTRNIVLFDDSKVKALSVNGVPVVTTEGAPDLRRASPGSQE